MCTLQFYFLPPNYIYGGFYSYRKTCEGTIKRCSHDPAAWCDSHRMCEYYRCGIYIMYIAVLIISEHEQSRVDYDPFKGIVGMEGD